MTKAARAVRRACVGLACFVGLASCASPEPPAPRPLDVQGHRGARGLLPENTLPAFARAIEIGVTTLELDVGLSADGVIVVAHDPWIEPRLCLAPDGSRLPGERGPLLRDLTLREIQSYDCGSLNPDPRRFPEPPRAERPGTPMPTLDAVFALAARRGSAVRFNVEIKAAPGDPATRPLSEMVEATVAAIERADAVDRATVQSFDWRALARAKERQPRLRTAGLVGPHNLDPSWLGGLDPEDFPDLLALLRAAPYVDEVSPWWEMLEPGPHFLGVEIAAFQKAGYRVVPWTVNEPAVMRRLIGLGVDGLISDYPDVLIAEARRVGRPLDPGGAR